MIRASLVFVALAACTPQVVQQPLPVDLTPVDLAALQTDLIAENPQARAFSAFSTSGKGVIFNLDGTATYVDPAQGERVETTISGFTENTMCVAQAGAWPGLCIDLYQSPTGDYLCEGTFGDGDLLNYPCTLRPFTPDA